MTSVANLSGTLTIDSAQFEARLKSSRATMDATAQNMQKNLASVDKGFTKLTGTSGQLGLGIASLARSILPVIGVGGLLAMAKNAIDAAGGLGELAQQLGVSTDGLQALRYAAAQSGIEAGELDSALAKLTRSIGEAADGSKAQLDAFNQLHVGVLNAQGGIRSTEEVLRDVSDALAKIQDPAARARLEVDLFGKSGQKLETVLAGGSGELDKFSESARQAGVIIDEQTIAAADRLSDKLEGLKSRFSALWQNIAVGVSGPGETFVDWVNSFLDFSGAKASDAILEGMTKGVADLAEKIAETKDALAHTTDSTLFNDLYQDLTKNEAKLEELRKKLSDYIHSTSSRDVGEMGRRGLLPITQAGNHNPPATGGGKSQSEKEVDAAIAKLKQLQAQVSEIGKTGFDLEFTKALEGLNLQNPGVAALVDKFREAAKAIQADKDATEALDAAWAGAKASMDAWNDAQAKGKAVTESLRTPYQAYGATMSELNQLLRDGAISQETWNRGAEQAKKTMREAESASSKLGSTLADLGATWSSAFEDAALSMQGAGFSAKSLGSALMGLGQDIERVLLRIGVTDPIAEGLTGALKSFDWSSLFGPGKYGISSGKMQSSGGGRRHLIGHLALLRAA